MARAAIAEFTMNSRLGVTYPFATETTVDTVNGHFFVYGPNKVLSVRNTSGSSQTITMTPSSQGLDIFTAPAKVIALAAGAQKFIGPLPAVYMHAEDNDRVYVDGSNAGVVLAVINTTEG